MTITNPYYLLLGVLIVVSIIILVSMRSSGKPNVTYLVVNDDVQQQLDDIANRAGAAMEANVLNRLREQLETDPELFQRVKAYSVETELAACMMIGDAIKGDIAMTQKELSEERGHVARGLTTHEPAVKSLEQELDHLMTQLRAVGGRIDNVVALHQS